MSPRAPLILLCCVAALWAASLAASSRSLERGASLPAATADRGEGPELLPGNEPPTAPALAAYALDAGCALTPGEGRRGAAEPSLDPLPGVLSDEGEPPGPFPAQERGPARPCAGPIYLHTRSFRC